MKRFKPYSQTLYVVWLNQIIFWPLLIFNFSWPLVLLSIIMMYIFGCMSEISIHRFFTHRSFQTTPFKEKCLVAMATLIGQGAILSWVTVHRAHHAFEDTTKDPHSPKHIAKWRLVLGLFPRFDYKVNLVSDLIRMKYRRYFQFENNYYWFIHTMIWIIAGLISFNLLFAIVSGSALWYLCTQLVNIVAHSDIGEKEFPNDVAINSKFLNYVTGAGYHNNHHARPKSHTYKTGNKIDPHAIIIEKFFIK